MQQSSETEDQTLSPDETQQEPSPPTESIKSIDLISEAEIASVRQDTEARTGLDLSNLQVAISRPGEERFDRIEIQHKLLNEKCGGDWDVFEAKYGFINQMPIGELREAVKEEGIALDGRLPGFAMTTDGSGEITFLMPPEDHAQTLAEYYATQRGDRLAFINPQASGEYLQSLAKEAYMHEIGHTYYESLGAENQEKWAEFIEQNPQIQRRVIEIQQNKYADPSQIPVSEEAFCDYFVNIASNRDVVSRLGTNPEAEKIIEDFLPQQTVEANLKAA